MRRLWFVLLAVVLAGGLASAYTVHYSSGVNGISITTTNLVTQFTDNHSGGAGTTFRATWIFIRSRAGSDACFFDTDGVATTSDDRLDAGQNVSITYDNRLGGEGFPALGAICDTGESATWDLSAGR